jgi:predicted porin
LEIGRAPDAVENLKIGATSLLISSTVASSGIARHIEFPAASGNILFEPTTLMNQNLGFTDGTLLKKPWNHSKYLHRISYYSPEFLGFQLGLSVTPNVALKNEDFGISVDPEKSNNLGYVVSAILNYIEVIWDVSLAVSVAAESNMENPIKSIPLAEGKNKEDHSLAAELSSREFGLSVSYFGITLAGSIGSNRRRILQDSLATKIGDAKDIRGHYVTAGGSYEIGSFMMSLVYFDSKYGDNKLTTMSYGLKKGITRNLAVFLEYIDYRYKTKPLEGTAKEFGVVMGILLNF